MGLLIAYKIHSQSRFVRGPAPAALLVALALTHGQQAVDQAAENLGSVGMSPQNPSKGSHLYITFRYNVTMHIYIYIDMYTYLGSGRETFEIT